MLLGLRDDDADDTILHSGLNMVLIDADIEAERLGKLTNPSLRNPVLLFELLSLQRLGDSGAGLFVRSVFIFNGYLACLDALPLLSASALVTEWNSLLQSLVSSLHYSVWWISVRRYTDKLQYWHDRMTRPEREANGGLIIRRSAMVF
jgi:hypothetical protein